MVRIFGEGNNEVLEDAPLRATKFLTGLGALPQVRTALAKAGMKEGHIGEGREHVLGCMAAPEIEAASSDTPESKAHREAVSELDQNDEGVFARVKATLRRCNPSACDFVFKDLAAAKGPDAVHGWAKLLARLDALEKGTDPTRAATRDADRAAIALLAERGFDAAARQHYAQLVTVALGPTPALTDRPTQPTADERREKLIAVKLWFDEWSTIARTVVKKRADLIRLGLATRRSPKAPGNGDDPLVE